MIDQPPETPRDPRSCPTCGIHKCDDAEHDAPRAHVFVGERCVNCGIESTLTGGYVVGGKCSGNAPRESPTLRERLLREADAEAESVEGYIEHADLMREAAAALTRVEQERDARIEPLRKSTDPEEAEAIRSTPDYVLYSREAADRESELHLSLRADLEQARQENEWLRTQTEKKQS